jgi:hypothetical protein
MELENCGKQLGRIGGWNRIATLTGLKGRLRPHCTCCWCAGVCTTFDVPGNERWMGESRVAVLESCTSYRVARCFHISTLHFMKLNNSLLCLRWLHCS